MLIAHVESTTILSNELDKSIRGMIVGTDMSTGTSDLNKLNGTLAHTLSVTNRT